jgi:hypothetical protein
MYKTTPFVMKSSGKLWTEIAEDESQHNVCRNITMGSSPLELEETLSARSMAWPPGAALRATSRTSPSAHRRYRTGWRRPERAPGVPAKFAILTEKRNRKRDRLVNEPYHNTTVQQCRAKQHLQRQVVYLSSQLEHSVLWALLPIDVTWRLQPCNNQ